MDMRIGIQWVMTVKAGVDDVNKRPIRSPKFEAIIVLVVVVVVHYAHEDSYRPYSVARRWGMEGFKLGLEVSADPGCQDARTVSYNLSTTISLDV